MFLWDRSLALDFILMIKQCLCFFDDLRVFCVLCCLYFKELLYYHAVRD